MHPEVLKVALNGVLGHEGPFCSRANRIPIMLEPSSIKPGPARPSYRSSYPPIQLCELALSKQQAKLGLKHERGSAARLSSPWVGRGVFTRALPCSRPSTSASLVNRRNLHSIRRDWSV